IVVIAHEYGADLEGQNIKVSDSEYIAYLENAEQLDNLLRQLIPTVSFCVVFGHLHIRNFYVTFSTK
ncbi:MAG: hypothetical protein LC778_21445, partial [Acidobacteria bacterium]|nr:hypothetical protein [Acidobacteriota bacterium]